ncbi:hypothetical protein CTAYLR_008761 [Chrysophaeum taylorii]|uniref:Major facilitator superfamily (MFS) profile domain-containing protein n=1 Tax=Chrysophaeum taylorii TaxID=2483200 RepID=A0AAD7XIA9_9STRA|nr:hypothetical protein CTAYLR_008761 [Chrysophaeum taylorii]
MTVRPSSKSVALAVLTLANSVNFWQRNLLYELYSANYIPRECAERCEGALFVPLCEECEGKCALCQECRAAHDAATYSLRDAACISDRQYGILAGFSFTTVFAASGAMAGTVADRFADVRWLHAGAVLTWSLATLLETISPSFEVLVASRVLVGIAQGFNAPCSYAVIAHHYAPAERATANGVYSAGTYVGSALSSLSLVAAMMLGWRGATALAVAAGFIGAALLRAVERPPRVVPPPCDCRGTNLVAAWHRVASNPRRLGAVYFASSVRATATVSLWTYLPLYYARAFPSFKVAFAILYAVGLFACGSFSSTAGGILADALARRGRRDARAHLPALGSLASALAIAAALYAPSFQASIAGLFAYILLAECWLGPCVALLASNGVPTHAVGTHVALLLAGNQLVACVGPYLISSLDDGTSAGLRHHVLLVVAAFSLAAALGFAFVGATSGGGDFHHDTIPDKHAPLLRSDAPTLSSHPPRHPAHGGGGCSTATGEGGATPSSPSFHAPIV